MSKRKELLGQRERLKNIEDIMRKDAEALFKDFKLKYQYKVTRKELDKDERIFWKGNEIHDFIRVDITPAPGVAHELAGLNFKARKIAPYTHLDVPVLYTFWEKFIVTKEGIIIPYTESYDMRDTYGIKPKYSHLPIESVIRISGPSLDEGEEKIDAIVKPHRDKILRIESWIKMGYPDGELVWTEEL